MQKNRDALNQYADNRSRAGVRKHEREERKLGGEGRTRSLSWLCLKASSAWGSADMVAPLVLLGCCAVGRMAPAAGINARLQFLVTRGFLTVLSVIFGDIKTRLVTSYRKYIGEIKQQMETQCRKGKEIWQNFTMTPPIWVQ